MKHKFVIIGAGPTGLGAAYRLKELGESDFVILEQTDRVGGLATSFIDAHGFTWDIGGHVQFSHYKYFDDLMIRALGKDGWLHHNRESWVWIKDRFVPYPFQNNIRYLPEESMWKCLDGLIEINRDGHQEKPHNFSEWILRTFGKGIAEEFLFPYNFKVWAHPLTEMSYHWIGERVAVTDLKKVTKNIIFKQDDFSWGPNNQFQFPKKGGTGAIWDSLGNLIGKENIAFNSAIAEVHAKEKKIVTASGKEYEYDYLLSTIPVDLLTVMIKGIPPEIKTNASGLKHSSAHIVGIGLKGKPNPDLKTKCWMYFPESNCPFYRVTVFSNYSYNNVPDINSQWSLMAETSESAHKPVNKDTILADTINGMLNTRLISSQEEIISQWHHRIEYGYPTPSIHRDKILNEVNPILEQHEIFSRGRFGAWKYEVSNQDHSMMQGVEWVNRMLLGIPELTMNYPETANANWGKKLS